MKKILVTVLAIMVVLGSVSALAAGKLRVEQENFMSVNDYSIYGYAYAKIQNVGDKPIQVNVGLLELYDENGDTLTSTDYLNVFAKYLQPDEYTYAYMAAKVEDAESTAVIDDYLLTITGKSGAELDLKLCFLAVTCSFDLSFSDSMSLSAHARGSFPFQAI